MKYNLAVLYQYKSLNIIFSFQTEIYPDHVFSKNSLQQHIIQFIYIHFIHFNIHFNSYNAKTLIRMQKNTSVNIENSKLIHRAITGKSQELSIKIKQFWEFPAKLLSTDCTLESKL